MKRISYFLLCLLVNGFCVAQEYEKTYIAKEQIFIEDNGFEIYLDDNILFVDQIFADENGLFFTHYLMPQPICPHCPSCHKEYGRFCTKCQNCGYLWPREDREKAIKEELERIRALNKRK